MRRASRALGLALAFCAGVALASVGVNKTFLPTNVSVGQSSTLTVILLNNNASPAAAAAFTDSLPGTVVVANPPNLVNGCGGALTGTSGVGSFSLSGATIPAAVGAVPGQCSVSVDVVSASTGVFINTIPVGALSSSQGSNTQAASATVTVAALQSITGNKTFAPGTVHGNGNPSTVTITLTNPNGVALTNAAFADNLPSGLAIAPTPNAATTCGGSVTAVAGATTASLAGGTIPASGSCTVTFDVIASAPNTNVDSNRTNTIGAGAVTTSQGAVNTSFSGSVRLQTGADMNKQISPGTITTGGNSTVTITIDNFNASALSPLAFTDTLPSSGSGSVLVAATPNVTISPSCGGPTVTAVAGSNSIQVTGGSLAGVAPNAGTTNTTCTITVALTGTNSTQDPITLTNTIPAGTFGTVNYGSTSDTLKINAVSSVTNSKSFSPGTVLQGGVSTLTVTLTNSAATPATLTTVFTDSLATMGASFTIAAAPPASMTCGGTLTAVPGANSFSIAAGGTIPAAGSCTITVPVQVAANAPTGGGATNTISQGTLQTDQGRTQSSTNDSLNVNPVLAVAKSFAPNTVAAGTDTRLTITLTRAANAIAMSGIAFTDTLPAGHVVSATPNLVSTCGGSATAAGNTVSLAGGALAGGASATSCTISVNVTTPVSNGSSTNTIPQNAVSSAEGFTNRSSASATITRAVTSVTLNKSFVPATVAVGGTSQLTINVLNTNANPIALTSGALTDTLPVGMVIATPPVASTTCVGGVLTAVAGASSVSMASASVAANATCKIQLNVVANASGNLINTLSAGSFVSTQNVTNPLPASATLAATGSADLAVTKTDGTSSATPGSTTTYTIVVTNGGPNAVAGANVIDPPVGVTFTGWTCVASAGSVCNASGSGPINEPVTLLNGGNVTFTVTALIASGATGSITTPRR